VQLQLDNQPALLRETKLFPLEPAIHLHIRNGKVYHALCQLLEELFGDSFLGSALRGCQAIHDAGTLTKEKLLELELWDISSLLGAHLLT